LGNDDAEPAKTQTKSSPHVVVKPPQLRGATQPTLERLSVLLERLVSESFTGKLVIELHLKRGGVAAIEAMSTMPL
jgi:hypothetical protein